MADEFDKWFPHSLADHTMRRDDICYAEEREKDADPDDLQRLEEHVLPSETRQALVPNRCQ